MTKTKILIVDDLQIVIEGIKSALEKYQEFLVFGGDQKVSDSMCNVSKAITFLQMKRNICFNRIIQ